MADSLVLKSRLLYLEDFATSALFQQQEDTVFGLGVIPLTPIFVGTSDAAAQAAGLSNGDVYLYVGSIPWRLRACQIGSGGGGVAVKLSGTLIFSGGIVLDGVVVTASQTAIVPGVIPGDFIDVGASITLPTGVFAIGKVVSAGTIAVEIWNMSGAQITLPPLAFNISTVH